MAEAQAKVGDKVTARRLFQFCFDHSSKDTAALPVEQARARIGEAFNLPEDTPREVRLSLLEEGITLIEKDGGLTDFDHDASCAVLWYASLAQTPEERMCALGWLRQAMPAPRKYFIFGFERGLGSISTLLIPPAN